MSRSNNRQISLFKHRYNLAKKAQVGETVTCPFCGKKFVKTTYQKTFCSNQKTRGTNNCKDNFWNRVDPEKRCRQTAYFFDVVLENYARERGFPDYETMYNYVDEGNGDPAHGGPVELAICGICELRADFCRCGEDDDGSGC